MIIIPTTETLKQKAIQDFHDHVSSGKVSFLESSMTWNLVMGRNGRARFFWDMDGERNTISTFTAMAECTTWGTAIRKSCKPWSMP